MRTIHLSVPIAALAFVALAAPVLAGDLASVERKILKEPAYTNKPAYLLLVLGAEKKTRVWIVRDGNTVYVDRNGNGDLTEAGEKVTGKTESDDSDDYKMLTTEFDLGDLAEIGGKKPYTGLSLRRYVLAPKLPGVAPSDSSTVALDIGGTHSQSVGPTFSAKAADAPIAHLDGPLEIRMAPTPKCEPQSFARDTDEHLYTFQIGTLGLGEGTWAPIGYDQIPEEVNPIAEMTFPAAKRDAPAIVAKFTLDSRC